MQEAEGLGRFKEDVHVGHVGVIDIQLLAVEDFKVCLAQVQAIPVLRGKVLRRKGDDKGPAGQHGDIVTVAGNLEHVFYQNVAGKVIVDEPVGEAAFLGVLGRFAHQEAVGIEQLVRVVGNLEILVAVHGVTGGAVFQQAAGKEHFLKDKAAGLDVLHLRKALDDVQFGGSRLGHDGELRGAGSHLFQGVYADVERGVTGPFQRLHAVPGLLVAGKFPGTVGLEFHFYKFGGAFIAHLHGGGAHGHGRVGGFVAGRQGQHSAKYNS